MQNYNLKFKILLFTLSLLTFHFSLLTCVYASSEFSLSHDLVYEVLDTGITNVTHNISLKNLTSNFYPSAYDLTFGGAINNFSGFDDWGKLQTEIKTDDYITKIHLLLNKKNVGLNNAYRFTLRYSSNEIAKKMGDVWEINLPKNLNDENVENYSIRLLVPESFGLASQIYPVPQNGYIWGKEALSGARIIFGKEQFFSFEILYEIENKSLFPVLKEFSLAPNTLYQNVSFQKLTPAPLQIYKNGEGNTLVKYFLWPRQKVQVSLLAKAQIFLSPKIENSANSSFYPEKELLSSQFWEVNDRQIKELADSFKIPQKIYEYVVSFLNYNYGLSLQKENQRLGAKKVLSNPGNALCTEFTDLFISIARAADIPAREVDGFAYTKNPKSHSWPEYWNKEKNIWVQIDPTWGKTGNLDYFHLFDLNHIALNIVETSSGINFPKIKVLFVNLISKNEFFEQKETIKEIWKIKPF